MNPYGYTVNPVSSTSAVLSPAFKVINMGDAALVVPNDASNLIITVPALTAGRTLTLPAVAQSAGRVINVVCTDTLGNILTIAGPGAGTIAGRCQQKGASRDDSYADFVNSAGAAELRMVATAVRSDRVNLYCTGERWIVDGYSSVVTNATPTFNFA